MKKPTRRSCLWTSTERPVDQSEFGLCFPPLIENLKHFLEEIYHDGKVFVFYDLNDGVDIEEYKEWSPTVGGPTCNASPICHSIEIYLLERKVEGKSFCRVAESSEVESWDAWEAALKLDEFAKMSEE